MATEIFLHTIRKTADIDGSSGACSRLLPRPPPSPRATSRPCRPPSSESTVLVYRVCSPIGCIARVEEASPPASSPLTSAAFAERTSLPTVCTVRVAEASPSLASNVRIVMEETSPPAPSASVCNALADRVLPPASGSWVCSVRMEGWSCVVRAWPYFTTSRTITSPGSTGVKCVYELVSGRGRGGRGRAGEQTRERVRERARVREIERA